MGEVPGLDGPELARTILSGLDTKSDGFCVVTDFAKNKTGGYIQPSYGGANHFAVLQELVIWSEGVTLNDNGEQISHRCHNPSCTLFGHLCLESAAKNNARKGCAVVWPCAHCLKFYMICSHEPRCIKYVPGFTSWDDFVANGVHN